MGVITLRMLRGAIGGEADGGKLARDQKVVAGLNIAIADFIARLNRSGMTSEDAQRLPDILRIARYYESMAELALAAASAKRETVAPAPAEFAKFVAQVEMFLDAVKPDARPDDLAHVELALGTLEEHYQLLKSRLLQYGAEGQLAVSDMDARLRSASIMRRAMQQSVKALRMLNSGMAVVAVDGPEKEIVPS